MRAPCGRRQWIQDLAEPSKSLRSTRGGSLKGFVVSGRWPDSTKEWAQLLMVAVRVASLPGLLSTTTIFGVREELPDEPAPGTVGLVLAEGTSSANQPLHQAISRIVSRRPC